MKEKSAILDTIQQYISNQDHFPVLNPEVARIQSEIVKSDPDLNSVMQLVQTDPTLTSEILKAANSPYYKGLEEVSTINEASLRIGQNELFNIIMRVIQRQLFSSKVPMIKKYQERLWNHSVACAFSALWLVRHLNIRELVSKAYIAGLLHDMGKLCLLCALEKMMTSKKETSGLPPSLIEKIQDALHAKLGYELLTRWHLPSHYCRIARDHHAPELDTSDTLLAVIRLANITCEKLERSDPQEDLSYISGSPEADFLGIKETSIALLEIALEDAGFVD